jgi:hypothetical protein
MAKPGEMNVNEPGHDSCELAIVFGVEEQPRTGTPKSADLCGHRGRSRLQAIILNCHQSNKNPRPIKLCPIKQFRLLAKPKLHDKRPPIYCQTLSV